MRAEQGAKIIVASISTIAILLGGLAVSPSAIADEGSTPLVSPAWDEDGARNYAINLANENAGEYSVNKASTLVSTVAQTEGKDAVVLQKYPQFGSLFVQAEDKNFAHDFADAAIKQGIALHSVGDTRQSIVREDEVVLPHSTSTFSSGDSSSNGTKQSEPITVTTYDDGLWGMAATGADKARDVIANDVKLSPVTVGIMDSGIDEWHEDLVRQIDAKNSTSCITNGIPDDDRDKRNQVRYDEMDAQNSSYHATHVAGIVAGETLSKSGFTYRNGIDPQAKLANIRVTYHNRIYPEYAVCGLNWSADHNIPIVNASISIDPWQYWMPDEPNQAAGYEVTRRATAYAQNHNVLLIAAAMNLNDDLDNLSTDSGSPNDNGNAIPNRPINGGKGIFASLPGVVVVSNVQKNTDGTLSRNGSSNYGAKSITIAAPGTDIASAYPWYIDTNPPYYNNDNGWATMTGTSMAAPHVAGVAALIKGIHPGYTAEQIKQQLISQADYGKLSAPTDGKEYRGAGLVDAYAAVTKNQPKATIESVEYSTDNGASWHPLNGAKVSGLITIRAVLSGAVTSGKMTGAATSEAAGAGTLTLTANADYSKLLTTKEQKLSITAFGGNNNADADDDTTVETSFTAIGISRGVLSRLSGAGRYDTMSAVVSEAFPSDSEYVVVASGEGYADALSASALAGGLNAPIVLTGKGGLGAQARSQIRRLGASKAIVIGSEASVSAQAERDLKSMGLSVDRASGADRYGTNLAVYRKGVELGVKWAKKMVVASGEGYADALSISSYAYRYKAPIFLAGRSGLSDAALKAAAGGGFSSAVVVGSQSVVPSGVDGSQLGSVGVSAERLAGADRYKTSAEVAKWCLKQGMGMDGAVFASGEGFADALSAGPLAAGSDAAIMLVRNASSPAVALAGEHSDGVKHAWVVGSSSVVDARTMNAIATTLKLTTKQ